MSTHEFYHSTLKDINQRLEIFKEQQEYEAKRLEYVPWMTGLYVRAALGSFFLGKKCKYPENPVKEKEEFVDIENMSTEELKELQEKEMLKLDAMAKAAFRDMEEQGE